MNASKPTAVQNLEELFRTQIKNLYAAERRSERILGELAASARTNMLKTTIQEHAAQTTEHINRLESVFESVGMHPSIGDAGVFASCAEACVRAVDDVSEQHVHDAALISTIQTLEHIEIAGYGCARAWARQLGHDEAVDLLSRTLEQEKQLDRRLSEIASQINAKAARHETRVKSGR